MASCMEQPGWPCEALQTWSSFESCICQPCSLTGNPNMIGSFFPTLACGNPLPQSRPDHNTRERERDVRDLDMMMSDHFIFGEDNREAVKSLMMIGWVSRSFRRREVRPVMTLQSTWFFRRQYLCVPTGEI